MCTFDVNEFTTNCPLAKFKTYSIFRAGGLVHRQCPFALLCLHHTSLFKIIAPSTPPFSQWQAMETNLQTLYNLAASEEAQSIKP